MDTNRIKSNQMDGKQNQFIFFPLNVNSSLFAMNSDDADFYTRNLFILFLVSLLTLMSCGVFEYFYYYERKLLDGPIHKQKQTLRFRIKTLIARLLMKLKKHDEIPDHLIDKLMVFNDKDEMVRFSIFTFNNNKQKYYANLKKNIFSANTARGCGLFQHKFRRWSNSIVCNSKTTKWSCKHNWYFKNSRIQQQTFGVANIPKNITLSNERRAKYFGSLHCSRHQNKIYFTEKGISSGI